MPKLALKYNQDFRKASIIEDIFEDVEEKNKDDNNVLSLQDRNIDNDGGDLDSEENKIKRKKYLFLALFFGFIIFFVIFVVVVLSDYKKISYLDFYECFNFIIKV